MSASVVCNTTRQAGKTMFPNQVWHGNLQEESNLSVHTVDKNAEKHYKITHNQT